MIVRLFVRALAAGSCLLTLACAGPAPEHGTLMADPAAAPALRLVGENGRPFDLAEQRHSMTAVYFGYTHCPDVCPATLADWARARRLLGDKGARVRVVFVSIDPARDTPQIAASFARQFDSTFTGLVAPAAELTQIQAGWHFVVQRDEMPGMNAAEYGVTHPAGVYLVDGNGRLIFIFSPGSTPDEIASDLRRLM